RDRQRRDLPLREQGGVVGEVVAVGVDRGGGRVADLDPVGEVAVLVGQAGRRVGHELTDDQRAGAGEQGPPLQGLGEGAGDRHGDGAPRAQHSGGGANHGLLLLLPKRVANGGGGHPPTVGYAGSGARFL